MDNDVLVGGTMRHAVCRQCPTLLPGPNDLAEQIKRSQVWHGSTLALSFELEPLMGLVWRVQDKKQPSLGTCRLNLERVSLHGIEMSVQNNTALGQQS